MATPPKGRTNFERMLEMANEVFASRHDPNQLDVNEDVLAHLRELHPASVSAHEAEGGPVAWLLLIPTTHELMNQFLNGKITERELYEQTPLKGSYDALYLCSAMVLPEYRRKGLIRKLASASMEAICKDHPIQYLFVWTFSHEGRLAAEALALATHLPLFERKSLAAQ